jgi:hypothetical protein
LDDENFKAGVTFAQMRLLHYVERVSETMITSHIPLQLNDEEKYNMAMTAGFELIQDKLKEIVLTDNQAIQDNPFLQMAFNDFWPKE